MTIAAKIKKAAPRVKKMTVSRFIVVSPDFAGV
jgi:hypothetical protein